MGTVSSLPYAVEEEIASSGSSSSSSVWKAHRGFRKEDREPVTILQFDRSRASPQAVQAAQNFIKRIKMLRHPQILRFIDASEIGEVTYLVTEAAVPLSLYLQDTKAEAPLGLHRIATALAFLNNDCGLVHGNFGAEAIWVTKAGEWKLAGLESAREFGDGRWISAHEFPFLAQRYFPPELAKRSREPQQVWSLDAWCFACLVYDVFNGEFRNPQELSMIREIPPQFQKEYKRLLATNPMQRMNTSDILKSVYFENDVVRTMDFLDQLSVKSQQEKDEFFRDIPEKLENFPDKLAKYRILPLLVSALQFGSASGAKVLTLVLSIGKSLSDEDFQSTVLPTLIKLYASNERAVRVTLLKNLFMYIHRIDDKVVNRDIFPSVKSGFTDTVSILREWTVKSLIHFIPKLKESTILNQVIPFIPRLQKDPEPAIRTNVVVVVGKVAKFLSESAREKTLIPTFSRALRDPFIPTRKSALAAFKATVEFYGPRDIAGKIMPVVSLHMVDPSRDVRETAFSSISQFIEILTKHSASMPEPDPEEIKANLEASYGSTDRPKEANSTNSGVSMVGAIGKYAVQSLAGKIFSGGDSSQPSENAKTTMKPEKSLVHDSNALTAAKDLSMSTGSTSSSLPVKKAISQNVWDDDFFDDIGDETGDDLITQLTLRDDAKIRRADSPKQVKKSTSTESFGDLNGFSNLVPDSTGVDSDDLFNFDPLSSNASMGKSNKSGTSNIESNLFLGLEGPKKPLKQNDIFRSTSNPAIAHSRSINRKDKVALGKSTTQLPSSVDQKKMTPAPAPSQDPWDDFFNS